MTVRELHAILTRALETDPDAPVVYPNHGWDEYGDGPIETAEHAELRDFFWAPPTSEKHNGRKFFIE